MEKIPACFPARLVREIERLLTRQSGGEERLSEIRLRADGRSALVLAGKNVFLSSRLSEEEIGAIFRALSGGALYAYRDTVAKGYLPLAGGVRVGVVGAARYEDGRIAGVRRVTGLVFRFPGAPSEVADDLYGEFLRGVSSGMLVYSPPGGGKTTALRGLCERLGSGKDAKRVVAIDERCELSGIARDATVDVLEGFSRAEGIEIAMRSLSPEVIAVDEIGGREEAEAVLSVLGGGVPLIATAHAGSLSELLGRRALAPLFEVGAFDVFCGIERVGAGRRLAVERVKR